MNLDACSEGLAGDIVDLCLRHDLGDREVGTIRLRSLQRRRRKPNLIGYADVLFHST